MKGLRDDLWKIAGQNAPVSDSESRNITAEPMHKRSENSGMETVHPLGGKTGDNSGKNIP